jgi:hypothetical protein
LLNPVNNEPKPDQNPENFLETALDSDSQVNSKLDKLFDLNSNVDDELEQLLQQLMIKCYEIIIEKVVSC